MTEPDGAMKTFAAFLGSRIASWRQGTPLFPTALLRPGLIRLALWHGIKPTTPGCLSGAERVIPPRMGMGTGRRRPNVPAPAANSFLSERIV
jgi:hypothetical protein